MEIYYHGYRGVIANTLMSLGIEPGDKIIIRLNDGTVIKGILMPRQALYADRPIVVIKLDNGYNIGIRFDEIASIELIAKKHVKEYMSTLPMDIKRAELPRVVLLGTGGTIASKVDYETGAVTPVLKPSEIIEWIPELGEIAYFDAYEIMNVFSEDLTPAHWEKISTEVYKNMMNGIDGVVIAHGTDTMAFTAAALAFSISNKPVPVVFVGAQRSSDRPSSDAALNLISAFVVAGKAPFAESVISMHGDISDKYIYVHRGVKTRKMHTSRRDAFQSVNDKPIAIVDPITRNIKIIGKIVEYRDKTKTPILKAKFDEKVAMIKAYPGIQSEIIDTLIDKGFHGIVIEGTGLGHIANKVIPSIKRAIESEIPVVMTSQCIFGRVNLNVYSTGRYLLEVGVIPASDMLSETAFVKLSWILGSITRNVDEIRELFLKNMVGEINERHVTSLYPRWVYE
ncbi:MAG: Glu-tRNA(Gln) amidotransferase subunit GatD [Desulfurococcaceae archaeon]